MAPLAVRVIRAEMRRQMPEWTMAQFRTMAFLYRRRGCSLRALAEHLGVTPPTGSALVDRLVDRGVVSRRISAASRREVSLRLTPRGRSRFERALDGSRRRMAEVLAGIPDRSLRRMTSDLIALAAVLSGQEAQAER